MALGSLVVEVAANVARFSSDMGRVAQIAEDNAKKIDRAFGVVGTSLKALGAGAAAGLTLDSIKKRIEGVIESAANLQQLSERTGAAVESLSGLASVAKLSNTDTDALAAGLQKLSRSMIDAQNGGAANIAAFKALGISVNELKGLKPDEAFKLIADRMADFADGAGKTAVAQQLLGKAGANLLPVMHDLAEVGELQVKTTAEQARLADEYEKTLVRLNAAQNAIWKRVAMEALPVMNEVAKLLLQNATAANGLKGQVEQLAQDKNLREWAQDAAIAFATVAETIMTMVSAARAVGGSFESVWADLSVLGTFAKNGGVVGLAFESNRKELAEALEKRNKTVAEANQRYVDLWNMDKLFLSRPLRERFAVMNAGQDDTFASAFARGAPKGKPDVPFNPHAGTVDTTSVIRKELDARLAAIESYVASQKRLLQQAEGWEEFYSQAGIKTVKEVELAKQALIEQNLADTLDAYEREKAAISESLNDQIAAIRRQTANGAELEKRLADARAGASMQYMGVLAKESKAREDAATAQEKSLQRILMLQAQVDLQTRDKTRTDAIANATAQFEIQQMGRGTLEALKANEARRIALDLQDRLYQARLKDKDIDTTAMEREAAQQTVTAIALIEDRYRKQRDSAFGANEALRKYAEDASNFAVQIENAMTGALRGMEDALVRFAMTGKLSFREFANSVIADIARILVRQQIAGPLASALQGAVGGLFGGLFGASGSGAWVGSGTFNGLSLGGSAGTRALGGDVAAGALYQVNETGREYFVPRVSGSVVPANSTAGVTVVQNLNISTGVAATVRAEMLGMLPAIQRSAVAAVADARMRGGSIALALK